MSRGSLEVSPCNAGRDGKRESGRRLLGSGRSGLLGRFGEGRTFEALGVARCGSGRLGILAGWGWLVWLLCFDGVCLWFYFCRALSLASLSFYRLTRLWEFLLISLSLVTI